MNTAGLRNKPIDRRRMSMTDRSSYKPSDRNSAIARVKSYKAFNSFQAKKKPFATEQKPGTGGFTGGIWQQQMRKMNAADARERAESFRPEEYDYISSDPEKNIEAQKEKLKRNMTWNEDGELFKVGRQTSRGGNNLLKDTSNLRGTDINYLSGDYDSEKFMNVEYSENPDKNPSKYYDGTDEHEYKKEKWYQ